ncbi:hypothetical protein U1Q18_032170 [Sarracenia purpurea var. burkii]
MPQGTLGQNLFGYSEMGMPPLTWKQRVAIALDVARGVEYLHGLAQQSFIRRDLKPSNILLRDDMRAKVSDFGLVKSAPNGKYSVEAKLAGTFGYLAPEYACPCPESSSPLIRPSDFRSIVPLNLYSGSLHLGGLTSPTDFDEWVPREAYLRLAMLRICGTVEGVVEAYPVGACESSGNASVFATKLIWLLLHVNPLYRSSSLAIQHRFFGFLFCDTSLTTPLLD